MKNTILQSSFSCQLLRLICKVLFYNTRLKLWQVLFIIQGHRRSKLVSCSPSFLNFQGALSVNKYEGKCSFSFFFYSISGVRSAGYNLYGKKGKAVTPSRKLQAKGDTPSLQTGKQRYQYPFVLVHVQNYTRELYRSSVRQPTIQGFLTSVHGIIKISLCVLFIYLFRCCFFFLFFFFATILPVSTVLKILHGQALTRTRLLIQLPDIGVILMYHLNM